MRAYIDTNPGRVCSITQYSPTSEKIALFRSLFRGREDLYLRRFVNRKMSKEGYSIACSNEWVWGICEKPKVKCAECKYRRFLPITDRVIQWHLMGVDELGQDFVMAIHPMLLDERCFFLVVDFNQSTWQSDALAFLKTCRAFNVPAALERAVLSHNGRIWLFFSEAIPASLARKLGSYLLTETMEHCPEIGLNAYDQLIPNQDTIPHSGFGSFVALPLQKMVRESGKSLFIDDTFTPFSDQWAFLATLNKLSLCEVEALVERAIARGRILGRHFRVPDEEEPPSSSRSKFFHSYPKITDLPKELEVVVGNEIFIPKKILPPALYNQLIRLAAFPNPEFSRNQAMRLHVSGTFRMISCSSDHPQHIGIPRGCEEELYRLFSELNIQLTVREELQRGIALDVAFIGELREEQKIAAEELLKTDLGLLSATTAFGKTVIGAWLISKRKVNTLILVHRKQLQEQWIERLSTFLNLPKDSIGRIGGGKSSLKGLVDVAVIQSLSRKGNVDERISQYGHLIIDECHHLPAFSVEQIVKASRAKFITGLTATVARKDGHHPIIFMRCGPIRYHVDAKLAAAQRPFEHTVFVRPTKFCSSSPVDQNNVRRRFHELYEELIEDEARNRMICDDLLAAVQQGRSPILLTERNRHLDTMYHLLVPHIHHLIVLRGGMTSKELMAATQQIATIPIEEPRVLLAMGRFVGEGFDDPRLDTLFLTLPISWRGTIAQYVGRLHRLYAQKREVQVYDYADLEVPVLEKMFNRRCQGYEAVGYRVLIPASAVVGWPTDVPLPVDPAWKANYAGSVKRLIRDGVDLPLAHLFNEVAGVIAKDAEGIERARSASERFLFHRLETLPETRGLFKLNQELDIPFGGWGQMEVDLLCQSAKLVIELDGAQHLDSVEAYRRDRRKDVLLQERGYRVLRFLTDDLGKYLDEVLDTILRNLSL